METKAVTVRTRLLLIGGRDSRAPLGGSRLVLSAISQANQVPRYLADCTVYRPTLITWGSYRPADDVLVTRPKRAQDKP